MMRRVLFAHLRAGVANIRAKATELFRKLGHSAHPLCRQRTDIGAFTTEANTAGHEIHIMSPRLHPDHVVAALIADLRAGPAGSNTFFHLVGHLMLVVHGGFLSDLR